MSEVQNRRVTINLSDTEWLEWDKRRHGLAWSKWIREIVNESRHRLEEEIAGGSSKVGSRSRPLSGGNTERGRPVHRIAGTVDDPFPRVVSE